MKHRIYNTVVSFYERRGTDEIREVIEDRCFAAINKYERKVAFVFTPEKAGLSEPKPTIQKAEETAANFFANNPDLINYAINFDFASVQIAGNDRALLKVHQNFVNPTKNDEKIDKLVNQIEKYGNKKVKELVAKLREVL